MGNELRKEVLVVDAMPSNKACIKFTNGETYYDISQKVQGYDLVKYGIVKGATVDVTFDAGNQVIYLKKKEGASTAQPAAQTSAPTAGDTKLWTVKAVAKNKKVIKFEESSEAWDKVSAEVEGLDLATLGVVPKAKVLVTFDKDNIVTAISKSAEEPNQEQGEQKSAEVGVSNQNTTNDSIQRQVCLKEAGAVVRSLIEMAREETATIADIQNLLKEFTKTCIESLN